MSPLHPCTDCFLFERRGVCPAATAAYGLQTPLTVADRIESERLHRAIVQDAASSRSLTQLVQIEARSQRLTGLLLPGRVAEPIPDDSRKETVRVLAARTPR